jgi:putative ABC transport system permease protein
VLIVSEIALTTVLLVGAGLMLRNLWLAARMNVGFDTGVTTAYTNIPMTGRPSPELWKASQAKSLAFMNSALESLRALPGVQSVAGGHQSSLFVAFEPSMTIQPASGGGEEEEARRAAFRVVTPGFFQTMGIPVLRGRPFDERDGLGSAPVVVVSDSLARELFADENPLGQRIVRPRNPRDKEPPEPWQIVGVVGDIRWSPLPSDPDPPEFYIPFAQNPMPYLSFAIRAEGEGDLIVNPVRSELMALNQNQPVRGLTTLGQEFTNKIRSESLFPAVMISFAALAVLLAAVGIYGLTSYAVSQRTQELGIRMALGAERGDIVRMVIRQGFRLGGLGIALGALGSWGLIHVLRSELTEAQLRQVGLTSVDTFTCVAVVAFLALVSVAANYLPARRATKVDPMTALRYE